MAGKFFFKKLAKTPVGNAVAVCCNSGEMVMGNHTPILCMDSKNIFDVTFLMNLQSCRGRSCSAEMGNLHHCYFCYDGLYTEPKDYGCLYSR